MREGGEAPVSGRIVQVAPSILSADPGRLAEEVRRVEEAGADAIHVDVMDGRFVPNITFGPQVVQAIRKATALPLDVHLMIVEPDRYLERFRDAGADLLTAHWEALPHVERTLAAIADTGALVGLALNPASPVSLLDDVFDEVDVLLIMSVNPGFGGQKFWARAIHKVEEAYRRRAGRDRPRIAVDGGVDAENAAALVRAGADILVSGSHLFGAPDMARAIDQLRQVTEIAPPP
jgi:ribulose-phosphate 3-epimerase